MDLTKLTPNDAAIALRGLERRYRGLFAGLGDDESPDDVGYRTTDDGWSMVGHIVTAAWALASADRSLAAVLAHDQPTLPAEDVDPTMRPKPGMPTGTIHERIAELGVEAAVLADRIDRVPAADWNREAIVDDGSGRRLDALAIVRSAIESSVEHLRAAEAVRNEVLDERIEPQ